MCWSVRVAYVLSRPLPRIAHNCRFFTCAIVDCAGCVIMIFIHMGFIATQRGLPSGRQHQVHRARPLALWALSVSAQMPGKSVALWKCFSIVNIFQTRPNVDRYTQLDEPHFACLNPGETRELEFRLPGRTLCGRWETWAETICIGLTKTILSCSAGWADAGISCCENEWQPADTISIVHSSSLTPAVLLYHLPPSPTPYHTYSYANQCQK